MNIGIDENTNLVYEGRGRMGFAVWPVPVMLQVAIYSTETERLQPPELHRMAPRSFIFREDTYNTASRIRRGRLYQAGNSQPVEWHVMPHPAIPDERRYVAAANDTLPKLLYTFSSIRLRPHLVASKIERPVFVLGSDHGFTIWSLVNVETSATGEELVTLKARQNIGALPNVNRKKILDAGANRIFEFIEKLEADIHGAGPESVIDRAREAATAICSAYLQTKCSAKPGNDLGVLASQLGDKGFGIAANLASSIARLHARGKSAERERAEHNGSTLRAIHEQDAQLAIQAVGTILCDLGWADW